MSPSPIALDADDNPSQVYVSTPGLRPGSRKLAVAAQGQTRVYGPTEALRYGSTQGAVAAEHTSAGQGVAAMTFLGNLASDLAKGPVDLPCFPNVVLKIRDALNDPKISLEETVKLVGTEPRLAARLLQTANSTAFNASGKRITELKTAITRLGQQLVQSAAMAFAVQQMKDEPRLRSIAQPLRALWQESIAVASICQVVARRTKLRTDEAFLTGLMHGIGRLYIMAHAVGQPAAVATELLASDLVAGWHPSIGKAVLENWEIGESVAQAVSEQTDYERGAAREADLTDVLIVSVILGQTLADAAPRTVPIDDATSFKHVGLSAVDCTAILTHAEYQLGSLQDALGC